MIQNIMREFRNIIMMSSWYAIAICSTMIMYTLLPILLSNIWWPEAAGIGIMLMTLSQLFIVSPISAYFTDKFSARKTLFIYGWAFIIWALLWLASYYTTSITVTSILIIWMTFAFSVWYGSKFVDVYTLRMSSSARSGIAFGILVTFAGLGRFLGTMIQPYLIDQSVQFWAPIIMIIAMVIFMIILLFIKDDHINTILYNKTEPSQHNLREKITQNISTYKETFQRGIVFIKRCNFYPLIPISVALWEWVFFWSLWFLVPMYLASHPEYISHGFEIGIYELISLLFAIVSWYIADKRNNRFSLFLGRWGLLIGIIILYYNPSIHILIWIGIIIWLSNNLLYATGQHILSQHDSDHEDDGAYTQLRSLISNLWYMIMPVIWWILYVGFGYKLQLFASIMSVFTILGITISFYLYVMREKIVALHEKNYCNKKSIWLE